MIEGDVGTSEIKALVSLNSRRREPVTARLYLLPGTAGLTDYVGLQAQGAHVGDRRRQEAGLDHDPQRHVIEPSEPFFIVVDQVVGARVGHGIATVTIVDNDYPIPNATTGLTAEQSRRRARWRRALVERRDGAAGGLAAHHLRVPGLDRRRHDVRCVDAAPGPARRTFFVHACGQGSPAPTRCAARNAKGAGARPGQATATGFSDTTAPCLTVESPTNRGNLDTISDDALTGDAGIEGGDTGAVPVKVYACNGCTNIAPTYSATLTPNGGTWTATPALAPGVYTVQATQTDWARHTPRRPAVTFEVRNAVFVSPFGSDANAGTVAAPKLTITAAASTAGAQGRPQVAVATGTVRAGRRDDDRASVTVLGGFDQFAGWTRPGTAGASGTPDRTQTMFTGTPQAVTVSGAVTVTLDALTINGLNTGLGAGASSYGVRAVGASAGSPATLYGHQHPGHRGAPARTAPTRPRPARTRRSSAATAPNGSITTRPATARAATPGAASHRRVRWRRR